MKTKTLLSILFAVSIMFGCKKENNQPNNGNGSNNNALVQPTTGTLYFQNTQTDPYVIYLDGDNIGTLAAGTKSGSYTITSGISHAVKATQSSGYYFYPTVFTGTTTSTPGGIIIWSF